MKTNYIAMRSNPALVEFRNYILSFYAYDGLYPTPWVNVAMVERGIMKYLMQCSDIAHPAEWGDGDSIDRERVFYIMEELAENK
jgi:hypothetical protein